jgi:hypothetical protein
MHPAGGLLGESQRLGEPEYDFERPQKDEISILVITITFKVEYSKLSLMLANGGAYPAAE